MVTLVRRMIRRVRRRISTNPLIYLAIASRFSIGQPTARDTQLVIEGFPRSANSFAEAAFRVAQPGEVKLAHHCHAAAQVIAAANWHIPCVVIIREPEEACRSLMMHHPGLFTVDDLFHEYIVFYEHIKLYRSAYVLARFKTVIERFPDVVLAVNHKFGTEFTVPRGDIKKAAFDEVDRLSQERGTTAGGSEPYSPNRDKGEREEREYKKAKVLALIQAGRSGKRFARARALFDELNADADL